MFIGRKTVLDHEHKLLDNANLLSPKILQHHPPSLLRLKLNNRTSRRQLLPKLPIIKKPLPQIFKQLISFLQLLLSLQIIFILANQEPIGIAAILAKEIDIDFLGYLEDFLAHLAGELHVVDYLD